MVYSLRGVDLPSLDKKKECLVIPLYIKKWIILSIWDVNPNNNFNDGSKKNDNNIPNDPT
jgi:hypothetical protein